MITCTSEQHLSPWASVKAMTPIVNVRGRRLSACARALNGVFLFSDEHGSAGRLAGRRASSDMRSVLMHRKNRNRKRRQTCLGKGASELFSPFCTRARCRPTALRTHPHPLGRIGPPPPDRRPLGGLTATTDGMKAEMKPQRGGSSENVWETPAGAPIIHLSAPSALGPTDAGRAAQRVLRACIRAHDGAAPAHRGPAASGRSALLPFAHQRAAAEEGASALPAVRGRGGPQVRERPHADALTAFLAMLSPLLFLPALASQAIT